MKLYEISEQLRELFSHEELDIDQLDALELAFDEKVEATCAVIREHEAESEAYKREIERLSANKRTADNTVERLKDYIRSHMEATGTGKIKGKLFNVTLGKPTQIVSISGDIPEKYSVVKTTVTPDRALIGRELKAGSTIENCSLVDGKSKLIIK